MSDEKALIKVHPEGEPETGMQPPEAALSLDTFAGKIQFRWAPDAEVSSLGNPEPKHISTSYVERQNLTMRMHMRRFTRLTNAFSKKLDNHIAAISLHFMYYNFVRIHQTLRITPAMAAGVTDRVWEIGDVIGLMEEHQAERRAVRSEQMLSNKGPALGF